MIEFRSRVEYHGEGAPNEAFDNLMGFKGIVTGKYSLDFDDGTYVEVTFMNDGCARIVNTKNLKEIEQDEDLNIFSMEH